MAGCRTSLATAVLLLLAFHAHSSAAVVITNGKKEVSGEGKGTADALTHTLI